jgi:hypothetical protein
MMQKLIISFTQVVVTQPSPHIIFTAWAEHDRPQKMLERTGGSSDIKSTARYNIIPGRLVGFKISHRS